MEEVWRNSGSIRAMADKEERRAVCNTKAAQCTICELRGIGLHKVTLGDGTNGPELEACLRRQGRIEKDHSWG